MASRATNDIVERLRQQHAAELAAVRGVADATERQAAAAVARDVAVAALAAVLGDAQRAAAVSGLAVAEVRAAQEQAPSGDVRVAVDRLRGRSGRGGRPPRLDGGPRRFAASVDVGRPAPLDGLAHD
ncbi:hypothetical protein ABZS66_59860 [Dactylosporangium sp. NPDC005572]|uniref:hypothetical protein n=1 Tax=Dactylosporangium sp. NPDC005572 TaxID=3156889 RepID=UPI0033B37C9A